MAKIMLLPLAAVVLLTVPFMLMAKKIKTGEKSAKAAFIGNLCTFAGIMLVGMIIPFTNLVAFAAEEGSTVKEAITTGAGIGYLAAGLSVGLACIGSGIAVGSGAPAAIGATSEDPKNFVKSLIFVVLGEGIALYGLLISMLIITGIGGLYHEILFAQRQYRYPDGYETGGYRGQGGTHSRRSLKGAGRGDGT